MYYTENDFRLYHHGILGQKWGKKNGPPYPLDAKDHSAAEKEAAKRRKEFVKSQESFKSRKKRALKSAKLDARAKKIGEKADKAFDKGRLKREAKLRSKQNKLEEARKVAMKDLTENELKVGQRFFEEHRSEMAAVRTAIIFGQKTGVGPLGAYFGAKAVNSHSKEGLETRNLDKQNRKEYRERVENKANANEEAYQASKSKKSKTVGDLPEKEKQQVYREVARHLNEELANREDQKNAQMSVARSKGKFDDDFIKQVRNNPKQKDKKWMEDEYSKYLDKKYLINETRQGIIDLGGTVQRPASARVYSDWNDLREELEKNYG